MEFKNTDALLVIDAQKDFCPGGSLAVNQGDLIMALIAKFSSMFENVIATMDWHPANHEAFCTTHDLPPFSTKMLSYGDEEQVLWPPHCVQDSSGAEFHPDVLPAISRARLIVRKGTNPRVHSYSGFYEDDRVTPTGLGGYLKQIGIERVFLVGLAYDYCLGYSALDAVREGFKAVVIKDLTRSIAIPVDTNDGTTITTADQMQIELARAGVVETYLAWITETDNEI